MRIRGAGLLFSLAVWAAAGAAAQTIAPGQPSEPVRFEGWAWEGHALEHDRPASPGVLPHPDEWLARDKALHAGASFLLTVSSQYVWETKLELTEGEALPLAITSALSLGLFKEVMDGQRPNGAHFCYRDLVADALGVLLGAGLVLL